MVTGPTIPLGELRSFEAYVQALKPRFVESGYVWDTDVPQDDVDVAVVAHPALPSILPPNYVNLVFTFSALEDLTPSLLEEHLSGCVALVRARYAPDPVALAYHLVPVLVVADLAEALRGALLEAPPRAFATRPVTITPVVYDLAASELVFSRRKRRLYYFLWSRLHAQLDSLLTW